MQHNYNKMDSSKIVLILGFVWPESKSSAAGSRMMQLIKIFTTQNYQVHFASSAQESQFSENLEENNIPTHSIVLNHQSFDLFVSQLQPNIVLFDRFLVEEQFGWRVAQHCPNALRVLDTEDLHSLRAARHNALKKNQDFILHHLLTEEVAKREIASILRCDISLIISKFEMQLLQKTFKIDKRLLHYLPLFFEEDSIEKQSQLPSFSNRNNFVFIGNFLHKPNVDAVLYLKNTIWPSLRKQFPKAIVLVYGAYTSQQIEQLHQENQGFLIKGRATSASEVIKNAKVMLAPLRFGAGIKGKLLDAMQYGTPSITSSIGAEAMHDTLPWGGAIADSVENFVNQAVAMYHDENLWNAAQNNGFEIAKSCFSKSNFEEEFIMLLDRVLNSLQQHRTANFMGAMLQHHTLQSSKYMSKWIEAKNNLES